MDVSQYRKSSHTSAAFAHLSAWDLSAKRQASGLVLVCDFRSRLTALRFARAVNYSRQSDPIQIPRRHRPRKRITRELWTRKHIALVDRRHTWKPHDIFRTGDTGSRQGRKHLPVLSGIASTLVPARATSPRKQTRRPSTDQL